MSLSPSEANDALRDIRKTEQASSTTYGYRIASPHLILWGVIWMIGYGATWLKPQWWVVWPVLGVAGMAANFWIGRASRAVRSGFDWRYAATALMVFLFIAAVFAILPPANGLQIGAFVPILVALFYGLIGVWGHSPRMLATGIAIGALTLGGYFWLQPLFLPWMAVVGGGGLVLGGIWLRTA